MEVKPDAKLYKASDIDLVGASVETAMQRSCNVCRRAVEGRLKVQGCEPWMDGNLLLVQLAGNLRGETG